MLEITREPLTWAFPFFVLIILIEVIINSVRDLKLYETKDTAASLMMGAGSLVIGLGLKILAFITMIWLHQFAIFDIGTAWWAWVLLFFMEDFSFYWHHRLSHEVRILWAAHVNHHSSQKLNYGTALRQSWAEQFYKYFFWLWLPIVGFQPWMIMTMMSINLIFQFLQHTELVGKLGPIEWIFNTPSHHRVHHASNARYLDRNHAGTLIIWDRLFGTFQEELEVEKPKYGITVNIDTYNPLKIASHEFIAIWNDVKNAKTIKGKLMYIFGPPGWNESGQHSTAKILRDSIRRQTAAPNDNKQQTAQAV